MQSDKDAPLFTVQSVVQGLASDSALLLSLVTTVERTATPAQKAAFVRHFVSLLLHCRDEGVFAGSELLSELFILDLDEAMWRQRDAAVFLRRSSTIVSSLLDQLSRETFSSPEGNLLPHLVATTRVLSAGDDASTSSIATPMGVSPGQWSHHSEDGPLVSSTQPDGMSVYDRFSTSELAGLSTAEQQFFNDLGPSPYLPHSFSSSVGGTGMEGSRPPLQASFASPASHSQQQHSHAQHQPQQQQQLARTVSPYGFNASGAAGSSNWRDSFRYTRDTDASNENGSRPATRTAFTGIQIREGVDFFSEAAAMADPRSVHNAELALNVVDVRAEAVLTLAFQIQDVVARHISDCPLVLRRAFWLWLRAASGRSGPPESAEVSPELPATTASAEAQTAPLNLPTSSSALRASSPPPAVSFEFVGMATMVMLHMLTPLLLSIPSFVLPVEEDEDSEAYVTTTTRFRFMAKVLQKAAYGVLFDERYEAGLTPLNRGMRELHRRWVSCFSALADYRNASSMNWCCPLPSPTRGLAVSLSSLSEEQAVLQRYFQFLDGFLVPYLQTTVLLRRFTEAIHLPQWLRCTYFAARFQRGQIGVVCPTAAAGAHATRLNGAAGVKGAGINDTKKQRGDDDDKDDAKLQRLGDAIAHVVAGLSTATCTNTTEVVSAFMANFISFLGTNAAKVTTIVIYEDLLRRYWAQFPRPNSTASGGGEGDTREHVSSLGRAEAAAVVAFYVYLAVQHNVVSPQFQLVLIPSVSAALRDNGQPRLFSSLAFSTTDTLQWLWQVLEDIPVCYRRHCDRIWSASIAAGQGRLDGEQSPIPHTALTIAAPHMPRLKICSSFSELMSCLFKGLSSYIPLSADDYHWMVCEQQQLQHQQRHQHADAAPGAAKHGSAHHRDAVKAPASGDCVCSPQEGATVAAAQPRPNRSAVSNALANTATLRSLRARWRRPLAVSESLSASGILPLHSTRGLFEVLCTITCRRLWTDGTLQPMAGVSALGALAQPLCAIAQLYGVAADVAATLLVAVDATPPPRWLRDLHFSHGSVSVHVGDSAERGGGGSSGPSSPGASPTVPRRINQVHWPQCGWFYPTVEESSGGEEEEGRTAPASAKGRTNGTSFTNATSATAAAAAMELNTQWESLMQHVLFFSSEFDANVPDYDADSNVAEQILSTRWGLCSNAGNSRSSSAGSAGTAASTSAGGAIIAAAGAGAAAAPVSEDARHITATAALTALHAVPSLRHLSIESLWRLFLFNVRQTCHIMRRMTPRECPFCRMEGAIADVLRGGSAVRKSPTVAVRPGFEESGSTFSERVSQAAADALRSCFPSEVTIVRLIVSVAAYVRNVHAVLERLRASNAAAVPASISLSSYKVVARDGTAQLLYGKAPLTAAQERLVDLLCFDGESLIQKAYLPYYENCTWHPYGRLLYDC